MDMTPFRPSRRPLRRLVKASVAALRAYFNEVRNLSGAAYVPARAKHWWIP